MTKTRWIALASLTPVAFALCGGGYLLYQEHLTGDVKRLLIAANDQNASEIEVRAYIAQARPLVRTKRDRQTLETFQRGLALLNQVQEDRQKDEEDFRDTMRSISILTEGDEGDKCFGQMYALIHIEKSYQEDNLKVPKELRDQIEAAHKDGKQCEDDAMKESDARMQREKKNKTLALQCVNSVRATLGLPQIPKEKEP